MTMLTKPVLTALRRFRDGTGGSVALEAMLLIPLLFWAYLAMFSYFDMLRQQALNEKASFTITDMLSRETDFINDTYVDNAALLFNSMIRSDSTTGLRVSVLKWDGNQEKFKVDWSEARGPANKLTTGDAGSYNDKLPIMPSNERIILVETWTNYKIPFKIGMNDFEINTFTFMRPRFAPLLPFSNEA